MSCVSTGSRLGEFPLHAGMITAINSSSTAIHPSILIMYGEPALPTCVI